MLKIYLGDQLVPIETEADITRVVKLLEAYKKVLNEPDGDTVPKGNEALAHLLEAKGSFLKLFALCVQVPALEQILLESFADFEKMKARYHMVSLKPKASA